MISPQRRRRKTGCRFVPHTYLVQTSRQPDIRDAVRQRVGGSGKVFVKPVMLQLIKVVNRTKEVRFLPLKASLRLFT